MIENLVLAGGGVKTIATLGVLKKMEELDLLKDIKNISGTSAGAIIGTLMCVGYKPTELIEHLFNTDLMSLTSFDYFNYFNNYGLETGNKLMELLQQFVKLKTDAITFFEFYSLTNITLTITGTCVDTHSVEYFNHLNTPDMEVLQALRISISIPFVFTSPIKDNKRYVDGGVLDNCPIGQFNDNLDKTIAITTTRKSEIDGPISSISSFAYKVIHCLILELRNMKGNEQYNNRTISIDTENITSTSFMINRVQKLRLIYIGYKTCEENIDKLIPS